MSEAQFDAMLAASRCFSGQSVAGWTLDASIMVPLLTALLLYSSGVLRLWRRAGIGNGAQEQQAAAFLFGWLFLAGALISPLHALSRNVFSAHMIEHEIVMAVAAPLLVWARPLGVFMWSIPQGLRRWIGGSMRRPVIACLWSAASAPLSATIMHGVAIWAWHLPPAFDAAVSTEWLHWLQHGSFLITALLFWWAILHPRGRSYGASIGYLFVTALHTGLLGVLLTLAPRVLYNQVLPPDWPLSALEDQQLAGLAMWIPAGLIYLGVGLALTAQFIAASGRLRDYGGGRHA